MYTEFIQSIATKQLTKTEYYKAIVIHRKAILQDVIDHGQHKVANKLGLTQPKLSSILNILRVL